MKPIVIDANLALGWVLPLPTSTFSTQLIQDWQANHRDLVVPALWQYEVTSAMRKAVVLNILNAERARDALAWIFDFEIRMILPSVEDHQQSSVWAERIGHSKSYDAEYVILAERTGAEFWSADLRLINALKATGVNWAFWVGES